ncbi:MAG TPA: DUF423 domain-containing protein [Bacteroidota bacterium]|nr:DUF423 domain-containing protein [Bacteroidota bacterium]
MTMKQTSTSELFVVLGCVSAALGVAAGAFGAHGLRGTLAPDLLAVYETAVRYQMYHALGMLAAGWLGTRFTSRFVAVAGWCFVTGTVLFSGSLYVLTLAGVRWLGAVTPFGGLAFIIGWLLLAVGVRKQESS